MTYRVVMARRLDASQPVSLTEIKQCSISLEGVHCEQRNAVFSYFTHAQTSFKLGSDAVLNVRFGSKADMCNAKRHVRFTPESGRVRCD